MPRKVQITRLGKMRRMKAVLGNITIICATCNLKLFEHVYWLEVDGWLFMYGFGSVAWMRSTLFIHGICFRE